jgi:hypothetical protein
VVLKASGRDARGQGNAAATVTAQMTPAGSDATVVSIVTDLSISGRVAQFGRGVMGDVSAKLLEQFVRNLEANVLTPGDGGAGAGQGGPAATATASAAAAPGQADAPAGGSAAPAGGGAPGGAAPGAAAAGAPVRPAPANVAGADAVRPMGIIVRSVTTRLGQSIARFFRRLAGRGT